VPVAVPVLGGAITNLTVDDATAILTGPNDAARQYFRLVREAPLCEQLRPLVRQAAAYKNLLQTAGSVASVLGKGAGDLDGYATAKALDGLFKMVVVEEQKIRENPMARTTALLKKIFGSAK
jgi:hypothetical protein